MASLIATGLITGVISVVVSLVLARLTFHFVKKPELQVALDNKKEELDKSFELKKLEIGETVRSELDAERQRRERDRAEQVRRQVIAYAGPILVCARDLGSRLNNILDSEGYGPLGAQWDRTIKPAAWSMTHDHFMNSTLYLFGRYFAWIQVLRERLGADEYITEHDKDSLHSCSQAVTNALSSFPAPYNIEGCPGGDAQVFTWQQVAMGEVLIERGQGDPGVISYPAFLDGLNKIQRHFEPLRSLLLDLAPMPTSNCQWCRVTTTRDAVLSVRKECERILQFSESARSGSDNDEG